MTTFRELSAQQRKIVFLHSAGPQGAGEGSDYLMRYLHQRLVPSFNLVAPHMPDPENPHYATWARVLDGLLTDGEDELILIGHSLGASVALKYLSEHQVPRTITGLFLISAVYWGTEDWEVPEYNFSLNFPSHLRDVAQIHFYHSVDDTVVPVSHLWKFAAALPDAMIREYKKEGHLFTRGIPHLVDDIKDIQPW